MKKKYHYTELSTKVCNERIGFKKGKPVHCGKPLKRRLVEAKAPHNITKCYKHHMANIWQPGGEG